MWAIRLVNLLIAFLAGGLWESNPPDGSLPAKVMVGMILCVVVLFFADVGLSSMEDNDNQNRLPSDQCNRPLSD